MGKSNKVECKKLDVLTGNQKCVFCNTTDIDETKYGPIYMHKNIITHYYCLLLSSNMEQNGRDCDGILGFLPNDINKEVKRGVRLFCSFCRVGGATLGCAVTKCKVVFHLPCGMKHSTLHQFFGEFKSYCAKHRPVQRISEKILAESSKGAICGICYEKVVPRPIHDTLWAPCCQKNAFFHRDCVQKLATSAGYFFKCPLCNNSNTFQQAMKEFGIYIPEQDASWECVPQAYQDLLVRHDTCDSAKCTCPNGRKTNIAGTRWELILCKYCGSQGIHIGCGRLKWKCPEFECDTCAQPASNSPQANSRNYNGNRHRLSGVNRTADIHSPVSADRAGEISDSSEDSLNVTISNKSRRVVSPIQQRRVKTPPSSRKTSDEVGEKKRAITSLRLDDPEDIKPRLEDVNPRSRAILIEDSDDDVEVVSETKGTGCVTTPDGCKIPVVQVRSDKKRPRAVGDVRILPEEIVDITKSHDPPKRPRIVSPVNITELEFSLEPPQPSTSSAPSTSFDPDPRRFVLVDQTNFRPEDLPPGTLLYRSVQPMVNVPHTQPQIPQVQPQLQMHRPQVQPPLQLHQPQVQQQVPTSVPMQQLGSDATGHADAKHSDLSKHWPWGGNYLNTFNLSQYSKKTSRALKCNSSGRRRGRNSGCDNNRLNPRVMLTPLRHRISSDGYFEILVPTRTKIISRGKMVSPLPSKPAKKRKISPKLDTKPPKKRKTIKSSGSKRKIKIKTVDSLSSGEIFEDLQEKGIKVGQEKRKMVGQKKEKKLNKTNTCQKNQLQTTPCKHTNGNSVITNFFAPTKDTIKKKKTLSATENKEISSGEKEKEKLKLLRNKSSLNKLSFEFSKRRRKKALLLIEEWKCKKIDSYIKTYKGNSKEGSTPDNDENILSRVCNQEDENRVMIKTMFSSLIELALSPTQDDNHTKEIGSDHNSDENSKDIPEQGEELVTWKDNVNKLGDNVNKLGSLKPENICCIEEDVSSAIPDLQDSQKQIQDSHNSLKDGLSMLVLMPQKTQDKNHIEETAPLSISGKNSEESHDRTDDSDVSLKDDTKRLLCSEDVSGILNSKNNTSQDLSIVKMLDKETHQDHQEHLDECVTAIKESILEKSISHSIANDVDANFNVQKRDIDDEIDFNKDRKQTNHDVQSIKPEEKSFRDENGGLHYCSTQGPPISSSSTLTHRTKLMSSGNKSIGRFPKIRFLPQVKSKKCSSSDVKKMNKSQIDNKSRKDKCKTIFETPSVIEGRVCKEESKSGINRYFTTTQNIVSKQKNKNSKSDLIENIGKAMSPGKRPLVELQLNVAPLCEF